MARPSSPALRLRILLWRLRRVGVAVGVLLVVLAVARVLAPPPPVTVPVVVTAHDVPAGTVLDAGDLRVVHLPPRAAPEATHPDVTNVVGRGVAVDLPGGLPVVDGLLRGERFGLDPPDGTVVVAVHLSGSAGAGLLRPGDRVDLVAPTELGWAAGAGEEARPAVLARSALVVSVGTGPDEPTSLLGGVAAGEEAGGFTLVAVSAEEGHRLASMSGTSQMGAVLVG